jgi:hypothetical protein
MFLCCWKRYLHSSSRHNVYVFFTIPFQARQGQWLIWASDSLKTSLPMNVVPVSVQSCPGGSVANRRILAPTLAAPQTFTLVAFLFESHSNVTVFVHMMQLIWRHFTVFIRIRNFVVLSNLRFRNVLYATVNYTFMMFCLDISHCRICYLE